MIIHQLFDDNDFTAHAIGESLFDEAEATAVSHVLAALRSLLERHPNGSDEDYVRDAQWPCLRNAAIAAWARLRDR